MLFSTGRRVIPSLRFLLSLALLPLALLLAPVALGGSQETDLDERIRVRAARRLDALVEQGKLPGASLAFILPDGAELTVTSGFASKEDQTKMSPTHRMPAGSAGKTFVAAVAVRLVLSGKLALEDPASKWLGEEEWFARLPNAGTLTLHNLLNHTSGIPEYYSQPEFIAELKKDTDRAWKPEELLAFVLDDPPLFSAGEGWSYADANFLVVGLIIERASEESFYGQVKRDLLKPHGLTRTLPTDRPDLPDLAQGYIVMGRFFGYPAHAVEEGVFAFNPQFEWCGGGFLSTPRDLAKWASVLYQGKAFEGDYLEALLGGVPTRPKSREKYGLGTFLQETKVGPMHGHDGFFPGYLTSMGYFPEHGFAAALQLNTDDLRALRVPSVHLVLEEYAAIAADELQIEKEEHQK